MRSDVRGGVNILDPARIERPASPVYRNSRATCDASFTAVQQSTHYSWLATSYVKSIVSIHCCTVRNVYINCTPIVTFRRSNVISVSLLLCTEIIVHIRNKLLPDCFIDSRNIKWQYNWQLSLWPGVWVRLPWTPITDEIHKSHFISINWVTICKR